MHFSQQDLHVGGKRYLHGGGGGGGGGGGR